MTTVREITPELCLSVLEEISKSPFFDEQESLEYEGWKEMLAIVLEEEANGRRIIH